MAERGKEMGDKAKDRKRREKEGERSDFFVPTKCYYHCSCSCLLFSLSSSSSSLSSSSVFINEVIVAVIRVLVADATEVEFFIGNGYGEK